MSSRSVIFKPEQQQQFNVSGFRKARVPKQFDEVQVALGTEESIYGVEYVTCVVNSNRLVKVISSSLEYT